jgi:hypothetical protein
MTNAPSNSSGSRTNYHHHHHHHHHRASISRQSPYNLRRRVMPTLLELDRWSLRQRLGANPPSQPLHTSTHPIANQSNASVVPIPVFPRLNPSTEIVEDASERAVSVATSSKGVQRGMSRSRLVDLLQEALDISNAVVVVEETNNDGIYK